ncbi:MAG TPA: glucose-1-phosphate thymidylyltransferase RfbA [Rhodospirillales bacterium]|nr:glucose-1-phosphate thymidylyltransferase RfbA [Rhodospirillales bacterium]
MKGIILAGGSGSRLHPVTLTVNKQLLPIYDKPMIFYPLSTLMLGGIRDILIITTAEAEAAFKSLLGDGSDLGITLTYAVQDRPNGLAEAFIIGRDFISDDQFTLILGDNIFYGHGLSEQLLQAAGRTSGCSIFAYQVADPRRYGVLVLDGDGKISGVVEKPETPPSNWAVTGLYYFDSKVADIAATIKPSARGELEIVDVLRDYLNRRALEVEWLGRGYAWLDTGTHETMLQAAHYIETIETRQGLKIACLEEIAWRSGYIDVDKFKHLADGYPESSYGQYLKTLAQTALT